MNKVYKHIWSETLGQPVVVSECAKGAKGKKKNTLASTLIAGTALLGAPAFADNPLPGGGEIVSGSGSIDQSGNTMTVTQSSQRMIANWQDFSIGADASVSFHQPGADAVALNRVIGSDPSQILGNLNANGQVFLINPNGVVFGQGAQVQTGGFVASTLDMADGDFLAGNYHFTGSGGEILNRGDLSGAVVALIAPSVINEGSITGDSSPDSATGVALAAGTDVLLDFDGDGLISVEVKASTLETLVDNRGLIRADGGTAILTARGASDVLKGMVNNSGTVQARTLENRNGRILLLGDMDNGEARIAGTLDASAPDGGDGGFIETSAATVKVADDALITTRAADGQTGTWLIDPTDFTVAAEGGDITGATLSAQLENNNVQIESYDGAVEAGGDVIVNDSVNWADTTLTLTAERSIEINAEMNASGTAGLVLEYAFSPWPIGGTYNINAPVNIAATGRFSTQERSDGTAIDYTIITDIAALQAINVDVEASATGNYVLGADIDAADTLNWNDGAGFMPLGGDRPGILAVFDGRFDGLGHEVSDLWINRPDTSYVGLFGVIGNDALVQNLGLNGGMVAGGNQTGALAGMVQDSDLLNISSSVRVRGDNVVGGLVGVLDDTGDTPALMRETRSSGDVTATFTVGGLVGVNQGGVIEDSRASGYVTATREGEESFAGGLVGVNVIGEDGQHGLVEYSHATGNVTGDSLLGGLVGYNAGGEINDSYASGDVTGSGTRGGVGGLVGVNGGHISLTYATGAVTATDPDSFGIGGLVGINGDDEVGNVDHSWSSGRVTGFDLVGGLVGINAIDSSDDEGGVQNSYWDMETSGQTDGCSAVALACNATGLTTAEALQSASYANFEQWEGQFGENWFMIDGETRPFLGSEYATAITNAHQLQLMAAYLDRDFTLANDIDMSELGDASGMWANGGAGFVPIGDNSNGDATSFTGNFDGLGHTIHGLTINRPSTYYAGLFGRTSGATIQYIGLSGGSVSGNGIVGGLIGYSLNSSVNNVYANVDISSTGDDIGGLVGINEGGTIDNAYATGSVTGDDLVGGLVGYNTNSAIIRNAWAAGRVSAAGSIAGGLLGGNAIDGSAVINGYYVGETSGQSDTGKGVEIATIADLTAALPDGFGANWDNRSGQVSPYLVRVAPDQLYVGGETELYTVVRTLDELQAMQDQLSLNYVLWNDIDAAASASWNDGAGFAPVGDYSSGNDTTSFTGNFDGLGHSISNLSINRPDTDFVGLFGFASGSTLRNIGLVDGSVTGRDFTGALVGVHTLGDVTDAYNTGSVAGGYFVGGLLGYTETSVISRVYSTGDVNGSGTDIGGLVGGLWYESRINDAYATGAVTGDASVGGLVGQNVTDSAITNAYALGRVTGNSNTGGLVGSNASGGTVTNGYYVGETSGQSDSGKGERLAAIAELTSAMPGGFDTAIWGNQDNRVAPYLVDVETLSTYVGSDTARYTVISTLEQLQGLDDPDGRYALFDDIDASYTLNWNDGAGFAPLDWNAASGFTGRFDGLGHSIYELTINRPDSDAVGLFSQLDAGGEIRNLRLEDVSISGKDWVGALAASNTGGIIDNVSVSGDIGGRNVVGGLVGVNESGSIITGSHASGEVEGDNAVGGLAGVNANGSEIIDSHAMVDVSGGISVGGLAGFNTGGGIDGSYATGKVVGSEEVGGLVGTNQHGLIIDSYATGTAEGLFLVGGLAGANVEGGQIAKSHATGSVFGDAYAGGLVGLLFDAEVAMSYAAGNVEGNEYAGGLVGRLEGSDNRISDAYATGAVTGHGSVGGLVGSILDGATITNSFATGIVDGSDPDRAGGLVGESGASTITASFHRDAGHDNGLGTLITDAEMRNPFTFIDAGWDFAHVWAKSSLGENNGTMMLRDAGPGTFYADYVQLIGNRNRIYGDANSGIPGMSANSIGAGNITVNWGSTIDRTTNAGTYAYSAENVLDVSTSSAGGVYVDYGTGTLTIDPRVISLGGSRTYDGGTGLDASIFALNNLANGDSLTLSGIGAMADKSAGDDKMVTLGSLALGDNSGLAANYTLAGGTHRVDIARAALALLGFTAGNKTYDGTSTAAITNTGSLDGIIGSDAVSFTHSGATFSDKHAGDDKTVTLSGVTLAGADTVNYSIVPTATTTADIHKAALAVTVDDDSKTYDGQAYSGGNGIRYSGFVAGEGEDDLSGELAFGGTSQGAVNAGSYTIAASGLTSGNYDITYTGGTLTIDRAALTLSTTDVRKTYDGTTAADGSAVVVAGQLFGSDSLDGGSFAFTDKNAGSGKTVTVSDVIVDDGNNGGNYTVTYADNTNSTIDRATITAVTGLTAADKTYDGTTAAVLDISGAGLTGMIAGDDLGIANASGAFGDKNAGAGKAVTISGLALAGADAGNYILDSASTVATANIHKATLTLSTADLRKTYDGTTAADGSAVVVAGQLFGSDSLDGGNFAFADKNAGSGKTVIVSDVIVDDGNNGGNYTVTYADNTNSTIDRATITAVTGITAADKTYDGTTTTVLDISGAGLTGMVAGDDLGIANASGAFGDKNAGTGKAVTISGLALAGADAGNYTLDSTSAVATADIHKATLTLSTADLRKTYDGNTTADGSAVVVAGQLYGSDSLSSGSFAFADKNAGSGKTVTISDITIDDGNNGGNYTVTYADNTNSTIDRANITAVTGIASMDKTYDGTTAAVLDIGGANLTGMIAGDDLRIMNASGTFGDKNAGIGKTVTISGLALTGADAGNYTLDPTSAVTTADIHKAALAITVNDDGKTYDGQAYTGGNGIRFSGFVAGEDEGDLSGELAFGGTSQGAVNAGSYTIAASGLTSGNYDIAYTEGTLTIDRAALTVSTTDVRKTYDGTTTADGSAVMVAGELFRSDSLSGGSFAFAGKNAGSGKTVTVSDVIVDDGNNGGNYTVTYVDNTSSTIDKATIVAVTGITAMDKLYDGSSSADLDTGKAAFSGMVAGDELAVATARGSFDDPAPGLDKNVSITGIALDGADAGNYVLLDSTAEASATVTDSRIAPLLPGQIAPAGITETDRSGVEMLADNRELLSIPAETESYIAECGQENWRDCNY